MQYIYLLHGKGGSPQGSVSQLEPLLRAGYPQCAFDRPLMPHHDPEALTETSVEYLASVLQPGWMVFACSRVWSIAWRFTPLATR